MAQATYIQEGDSIDYTPEADVAAGDVVFLGDLAGVAKRDLKAGEPGALAIRGVFEVGFYETPNIGQTMYWAGTKATVDDASGVNPRLGTAVSIPNSWSVNVLINQ